MAKARASFFGTLVLIGMSMMRWHGKTKAEGGQGYSNPIFSPRRKKFKGYMRENRRSSFNKNK